MTVIVGAFFDYLRRSRHIHFHGELNYRTNPRIVLDDLDAAMHVLNDQLADLETQAEHIVGEALLTTVQA